MPARPSDLPLFGMTTRGFWQRSARWTVVAVLVLAVGLRAGLGNHQAGLWTALLRRPQLDFEGSLGLLWLIGMGGLWLSYRRNRRLEAKASSALAELNASEELFSRAFALNPDAISINRLEDGAYLAANEGFTRITGYGPEEILGRTSLDQDHCLWADPEERRALVATLRQGGEVMGFEASFLHKDGKLLTGLMSAKRIEIAGEACILAICRDITEEKRAERTRLQLATELAQAHKMESLGTLASGVAHDLNNILAAILAITETLSLSHTGDETVVQATKVIQHAGERGRDLVKGLTLFARREIQEAHPVAINQLVREETAILGRTLPRQVELVRELEEPLPQVMGEGSTLASVLVNLCVNAVDAMPGGGTLTIRTRARPDHWVELSVEDTGQGMPQEILARAMEPFFTTKPAGKGTGLGLAMAYSTAKAHGGTLAIRSTPGEGTLVTMCLPAAG